MWEFDRLSSLIWAILTEMCPSWGGRSWWWGGHSFVININWSWHIASCVTRVEGQYTRSNEWRAFHPCDNFLLVRVFQVLGSAGNRPPDVVTGEADGSRDRLQRPVWASFLRLLSAVLQHLTGRVSLSSRCSLVLLCALNYNLNIIWSQTSLRVRYFLVCHVADICYSWFNYVYVTVTPWSRVYHWEVVCLTFGSLSSLTFEG